jgi:3-dehydroquinate synthase
MMEKIQLQTYPIFVGDIWQELRHFLATSAYEQAIVLVDDNTDTHCLPIFKAQLPDLSFEVIRVPAGEQHKNLVSCQHIWSSLFHLGAGRKAVLINLGGGVIGDMGGFCASTFKRGMPFIQIPTTLLSQVDASVGGKLGIDFMDIKNGVGVFNNPEAVFIDPVFFETLPAQELRSGYAEVIKHSLIHDADQWDALRRLKDLPSIDWAALLVPSLKIKQYFVTEDPRERGLRKALNFGHTIGHAVEGLALKSDHPLLHGEAIAIGMVCETFLSFLQCQLPQEEVAHISRYLLEIYGHHPIDLQRFDDYIALMQNDKKNEQGQINFSLLPQAGSVAVNQHCSAGWILQSLQYYNDLASVIVTK